MSAVNPAWCIQASSHPADVFRRMTRFTAHGQQGVRDYVSGDLLVSQNGTPNMSVNVAAGEALINGTQNTTSQGAYHCLNDATVNLAIAASDPTNPRIDIVVAQVQDAAYSGATNAWSLAVVTGTPAPSPSPPATPANAITLGQVAVAANATSITNGNITDKRPVFGSLFHASVYQSAAGQSIPNNTSTKLIFDAIEEDANGNWSVVNNQYTFPVPGRVLVLSSVLFSSPTVAVNPIYVSVWKGGSAYRRGVEVQATGSGAPANPSSTMAAVVKGNAGDLLEIHVQQIAGTSYNTLNGAEWTWAQFQYLGA